MCQTAERPAEFAARLEKLEFLQRGLQSASLAPEPALAHCLPFPGRVCAILAESLPFGPFSTSPWVSSPICLSDPPGARFGALRPGESMDYSSEFRLEPGVRQRAVQNGAQGTLRNRLRFRRAGRELLSLGQFSAWCTNGAESRLRQALPGALGSTPMESSE